MGDGAAVLTGAAAGGAVVHVVPANGGGVDRHVRDIIALRPQDAIAHVAADQVVFEIGPPVERLIAPVDRSRWHAAIAQGAFGQPTALHVHSALAPARAFVAAWQTVAATPWIITLHDIDFVADGVDADERRARHDFVRSAAARVVPSRFIARSLDDALGAECERTLIINGISPPRPSIELPAARTAVDPSLPPLPIAVIGALGKHKGLDFLFDVVAQSSADVRFVIIGYVDGRLDPGWLIPDRLFMHGPFEPSELPALVAAYRCRLAFFPNRQPESHGYALSDAWRAGLPAFGPDHGALGERIGEHGGGWCYRANADADVVAAALASHLMDDARAGADAAAKAGAALASCEDMVAALGALYARVGSGRVASPPARAALAALTAVHFDGALFREELRRLAGDLAFEHTQRERILREIDQLADESRRRGERISCLERDAAALQEQIRHDRETYVQEELKLRRDVTDTLAIAHHYERALALLPRPLRGWLLRRTAKTDSKP